jgi:hypothetical protein|tara:strand:+ start:94 stop:771 length:678 start_codon:yes stop_codon:yes gene_type:complete
MAALSDYLESGILNHIFRDYTLNKPTQISIALTSGVPLDSDSGTTIPELPSGTTQGNTSLSTGYSRINLAAPSNDTWHEVGEDTQTAYTVYQDSNVASESGYFYPLYLNKATADSESSNLSSNTHTFSEFPNVNFYAPQSEESLAQTSNPGFLVYEGNGFIKNKASFVFDTALTDWGWVSGIAILDDATYGSGNMLMYAQLTNPRYVYIGDNIKFDALSLEICLK